tara:strand:- start:3709 stop:4893 length:1185 start_codon:yes stop_codon:yes gene_type:complete
MTGSISEAVNDSISDLSLAPLSLYIHIPWCLKKCPYCDFNSHEFDRVLPEQDYVDSLLEDLILDLPYVQGRSLQSIFIGGGTPSLFSPAALHKLLETIQSLIPFAGDIEITLEANPGTFEQEKFSDFRQTGINRLSIGIQSFQQNFLEKLGRVHDAREALAAPDIARKAGFNNFNLDLMFALPGQNIEQALDDLQQAVDCQAAHISWYQLTIEPNTVFYRRPPRLPLANLIDRMQDGGIALLESSGYSRYEISAFSQPGQQARHNLNYWQFGDYLGIGAGAHGKISLPQENRIVRTRKLKQPKAYLAANGESGFTVQSDNIPAQDLTLEFMMNALRLTGGVSRELFQARTGLSLKSIDAILISLQEQNLLRTDTLATTPKGLNLLNNVLHAFMI